jgi:hypothetical protein
MEITTIRGREIITKVDWTATLNALEIGSKIPISYSEMRVDKVRNMCCAHGKRKGRRLSVADVPSKKLCIVTREE